MDSVPTLVLGSATGHLSGCCRVFPEELSVLGVWLGIALSGVSHSTPKGRDMALGQLQK